jgi:CRISPR-associated endonuclease/helicase Cas3
VIVPTGLDFGTHAAVYPDVRTLWRTQQLLASSASLDFPGAYRDWIERVYDEEPWPEEPEAITKVSDDVYGARAGAFCEALRLADSAVSPFADTDAKVTVLTRDGEMNLTVLPVLEERGRRLLLDGQAIESIEEWRRDETLDLNAIPVPASWRPYLPPADEEGRHVLAMRAASGDEWTAETDRALFRYSTFYGLERLKT